MDGSCQVAGLTQSACAPLSTNGDKSPESRHHWISSSGWLLETCEAKYKVGFLPSEKFPIINFRGSVQCFCSRSDAVLEVWRTCCVLAEPAVAQRGHGVPHMALRNCPVGFRELEKSARAGGL